MILECIVGCVEEFVCCYGVVEVCIGICGCEVLVFEFEDLVLGV